MSSADAAYRAMMFARHAHRGHKRKYTNAPYTDHLAEVAAIVSAVTEGHPLRELMIAVSWLHDSIEDVGVTREEIEAEFGFIVAGGVLDLSDLEEGNRARRKALSRIRLERAPEWVQTIKLADLISNTGSIVEFDPDFAKIYLEEKRLLLSMMQKGDPRLMALAIKLSERV